MLAMSFVHSDEFWQMTHKSHERNEESGTYQKLQNYLQVGKITKYVKESGDERDVKRKYKWEGRKEEKGRMRDTINTRKRKEKKKKK